MSKEYGIERLEGDFIALCTTISSVYDLRGIGVSAAYVSREMWDWMQEQNRERLNIKRDIFGNPYTYAAQCFIDVAAEFHHTKSGSLAVTIKPYGSERIPVKVKYSGKNPWKITVGYRKEQS